MNPASLIYSKKRNSFKYSSIILMVLILQIPCIAFAAETNGATGNGMSMSIIYGVSTVSSFLLLLGYGALVRKKEIWMLLLFTSVFIINVGYFTLSLSKTLGEALLANRIAYLGSVFLPLFMLMTIAGVCRLRCGKWLLGGLICVSIVVFLIAASPGYLDYYYKEVSLVFVNGVAKLEKVYGSLHKCYYIYLFAYFAMMIGTILYSVWKKQIAFFQHASLLLVVVLLNIAIWFVEQLIHWDFEFLSVSYIISELLMLILYSMLQEYEQLQLQPVTETVVKEALQKEPEAVEPEAVVTFEIDQIVAYWSEVVKLSPREQDIFRAILEDKKRKEIAEELCISENTVKTHITNVFSKFEVSTRSELFAKVMQSKIGCE